MEKNIMRVFRLGLGLIALILAATLAPPVGASPFSVSLANDILSSCTGEYFNNTDLAGSPVLVRTDPAINFFWPEGASPGPGVTVDNYSVRWTCYVNVTTAGTYTVNVLTDDGMNVLVDGNLVIWAWYDQGPTAYSNSIYLYPGGHTVRVEYYNHTNGGTAQVSSNLIGSGGYYPPPPTVPPPYTSGFLSGCTGEYFNNISLAGSPTFVRTDGALNFYWPQGTSPGPGINASNYSVRWTCYVNVATAGAYTVNILTDDGMNVWVDGNLVIGAWYDQPPAAYSNSIYLNAGGHTVRVEYYNHTNGGTAQVSSTFAGGGGYYPPPAPYTSGLLSNCTGRYFNNTDLAGSPVLVRTDPAINFFWPEGASPGPGINATNYSVRWTCYVNVATAGTYTVNVLTDDGINVLVDGNLVIWAWYDQGPTAYSNSGYLNAGVHTVRIQYYNHTNGGTAQVSVH